MFVGLESRGHCPVRCLGSNRLMDITSELIEEKLDLVRRYLLQALKGLEAKEKKLQAVEESVRKSSEQLFVIQDPIQERLKLKGEEKGSHLLLKKGCKNLEIKRKKLDLIQTGLKIRLEGLNEKEKLIKGLFEEMKEFESFVGTHLKEKQVDNHKRELDLISENGFDEKREKLERLVKEIETRERALGLKKEVLIAKENEFKVREKILGLKEKELVARENKLDAREKVLELRQDNEVEAGEKILNMTEELDLKGRELESNRKSIEPHSMMELRQKSRKRKSTDANGNCKGLKKCSRAEGSFSGIDENAAELADGINSTGDHKESDSEAGARPYSGAGDTSNSDEDDHQVKLEATSGPENDAGQTYPGSRYISNLNPIGCSNLLFNDFDKDKLKCLAAGQIWACYSEEDDLPRSYLRVLRVLNKSRRSRLAKLQIEWLQPLPQYLAWKKGWKKLKSVSSSVCEKSWKGWIDADLPVGCGVFKRGKEQTLSLWLDKFSDQVSCKNVHSHYLIHPGKGETWALYKDWDIVRWASNPKDHTHCNYEIVEILDRNANGTRVVYLDKLRGFVSLFQRRSQSEKDSFLIEDRELFRFSHKVPSHKMTGYEEQGVPAGSFELDPKDLPACLC